MWTTWPETYADLGDRRNASVDSSPPSRPGDVDQLDGAAAADLLAERAGEAFERPLGDPLGTFDGLGRRAEHHQAGAGLEAAQQRAEEVTQQNEPDESVMPVASNTSPRYRVSGSATCVWVAAEDVEERGQRLGEPPVATAAVSTGR